MDSHIELTVNVTDDGQVTFVQWQWRGHADGNGTETTCDGAVAAAMARYRKDHPA